MSLVLKVRELFRKSLGFEIVGKEIKNRDFTKELRILTSKSSGPGGQHANKVSSKVELAFNIASSEVLEEEEKELLLEKYKDRLTKDGQLRLVSQKSRSQHRNKAIVVKRFIWLLEQGLIPEKKRKPTKRSQASHRQRRMAKKRRSDIKKLRGRPLSTEF